MSVVDQICPVQANDLLCGIAGMDVARYSATCQLVQLAATDSPVILPENLRLGGRLFGTLRHWFSRRSLGVSRRSLSSVRPELGRSAAEQTRQRIAVPSSLGPESSASWDDRNRRGCLAAVSVFRSVWRPGTSIVLRRLHASLRLRS